ncbi:hypothetical protein ABE522_05985 [Stenotrophomonas pennii]|uniref:hypothetical protein n=1 Tax=Stenotrophomonas lacuserhaii TaxID=2760084 RepID=UPI00320AD2E1
MTCFNKTMMPILLAVALLAVTHNVRAGNESITSTRTIVVDARSADGAAARAWIERNSPDFRPRLDAEQMEISRTVVVSSDNVQRTPGDNPPIPLPASGKPGEVISFSSQRNGGLESWTYKWRAGSKGGGSWSLIGYTFKYFDEQER